MPANKNKNTASLQVSLSIYREEIKPHQAKRLQLSDFAQRFSRLDRIVRMGFGVFQFGVGGAVLTAMILSFALGVVLLAQLMPSLPIWLNYAFCWIPSLISGTIGGMLMGNALIRLISGLNRDERLSLAFHLPVTKVPSYWPAALVNWLYSADWLTCHDTDASPVLYRAFVTGDNITNCQEEVGLWQMIAAATQRESELLPGNILSGWSARDIVIMDRLPRWADKINPGADLSCLAEQIGADAASQWTSSVAKQAACVFPQFEFCYHDCESLDLNLHPCQLEDGRSCLLVTLQPKVRQYSESEINYSLRKIGYHSDNQHNSHDNNIDAAA